MKKTFLIMTAIGLSAIGIGYGLFPKYLASNYLGFQLENPNLLNIIRCFLGIYIYTASGWLLASKDPKRYNEGIRSVVFFMSALVIMRFISIALDGIPGNIVLFFLAIEIITILQGIYLLQKTFNIEQ